ncbi:MAG: hypothetical protein R3F17_00380 [Planctomycetota bacterium]
MAHLELGEAGSLDVEVLGGSETHLLVRGPGRADLDIPIETLRQVEFKARRVGTACPNPGRRRSPLPPGGRCSTRSMAC